MSNIEFTEEELHRSSILGSMGRAVRHFKGNIYITMYIAESTLTGKKEMVYKAIYGECKVYTRELEEFLSEVDTVKYPNATQKYRLELVELVDETSI